VNDIGPEDWENQIAKVFKKKIIEEFSEFHIFVEADLQSSLSRFMREFVIKHNNPHWKIYNQPYQKMNKSNKGKYPDLLLTRKGKKRIAIELKQSALRKNVPFENVVEDVHKLGVMGRTINKTYLIYTCYVVDEQKQKEEKARLQNVANEYENPPNILIINLTCITDHGSWKTEMSKHMTNLSEYYGGAKV
jgi:hypothetical protein